MYYGKTYHNFSSLKKSIENWIYYYNNKRIKKEIRRIKSN
ncbi:hypothetical protein CBF34_02300 [Vagococcus penaei]|nr:hypothetical protein CBF34_02300 [Vagococcus penaei]